MPPTKVPDIFHGVDRWTASLSLGRVRLSCKTEDPETIEKEGKTKRVRIDYWDLYVRRCNGEARRIQSLGWLSQDDIQGGNSVDILDLGRPFALFWLLCQLWVYFELAVWSSYVNTSTFVCHS